MKSSHSGHRRIQRIDEVAESLRKAEEDLEILQERFGSQGPGDLQHDGAAVNGTQRSFHGDGTPEVSPPHMSKIERKKIHMVPKRALNEPSKMSSASLRRQNTDLGCTQLNDGDTGESPVDGHDQPKIYTIRDHTLKVTMHPSVLDF